MPPRANSPVLATCHLWFEDSDAKWTYRALSRLERRLYRRFDRLVAVSDAIAVKLPAWNVPADRLSVIRNGIALEDAPRSAGDLAELRRRCGVPADAFLAINIGRLADQKAQADLIEAAARVRATHPHVHVLILGEGHLRPALERQIHDAGLQDHARIVGFQENVREYLAMADAFVLPSVDEGLPIALLEALAVGVPAICTPVGAIPQLLEHESSALFVPVHGIDDLATAINRLIEQPSLREALASRGLGAVRQGHSAQAMYREYHALYERLIT